MEAPYRKRMLLAALVIYLAAVAISTYFLELKRTSLQFHQRDYPYFIEQAAKLADPRLTNRYATNIDGYNFLGLQGPEGVKAIYQAIHTEYFRYFYTPLYALFGSPLPIFLFFCLVFYLPFLYFAFLLQKQPAASWKPLLLLIGLFLLFPGWFDTVTFDLRSRIQFISAWILLMLAIYYRRPFLERLVGFLFLLCIREEGILLGLFAIAIDFARSRQWKASLVFLGLDAAALAAFLAFMSWGGYDRVEWMFDPLAFASRFLSNPAAWLLMLAAALGIGLVGWRVWRKRRERFSDFLQLLLYLGAVGLAGASMYRALLTWVERASLLGPVSAWDMFIHMLTDPSNTLVYYMLFFLLVLLWLDGFGLAPGSSASGRARRWLQAVMLALCILFAAISLTILPERVDSLQQQVAPAQLVWDYKARMNRYQDAVLVDFNTYQAFYDCEKITVYNRLPLYMVESYERYYPENKTILVRLIRDRIQYVVISRSSYAAVSELIRMAGLPSIELFSNEKYLVLKLR